MISKIKYLLVVYLLFSCHTQQKSNFSNNELEANIYELILRHSF